MKGATLLKILPHASEADAQGKLPPPVYLDEERFRLYSDAEGSHFLREVQPSHEGYLLSGNGSAGTPRAKIVRHESGRPAHVADLVRAATVHYWQDVANLTGRKVQCKFRDEHGSLIALDLTPTDVHQPAVNPTYAAGYRVGQNGIADVMSPVIPVPKKTDYYGTWNAASDFSAPQGEVSAAGGQIAEINPGLTFSTYDAVSYALAGALPTEVLANADTPFQPLPKLMQVLVDKLKLARNIRVANQMQTSGSWNTNLVQTILSGSQWNEGPAGNPLLVIHAMMDSTYAPITGFGLTGQLFRDMCRHPNVQKYFEFKDKVDGIPTPEAFARELKLPPFYLDETKYTVGGKLSYVWGNALVAIHEAASNVSQQDVSTAKTWRWIGGEVPPDGQLTGGFLVRSYFDQKRGPRGSTVVVCAHNDAESMTSGLVGGLVLAAHQ